MTAILATAAYALVIITFTDTHGPCRQFTTLHGCTTPGFAGIGEFLPLPLLDPNPPHERTVTMANNPQPTDTTPEPSIIPLDATTDNGPPQNDPVLISTQGEFYLEPEEDLPIHPAAKMFPVSPDQTDELANSMSVNGQIESVSVFDNKILDGQRRNLARKQLGIRLRCKQQTDLEGLTPFEWAVRKNMAAGAARHLADSQRALIGARLCREIYEPRAEKRAKGGKKVPDEERNRACADAAVAVNVKVNRLRKAMKVIDAKWKPLEAAVWTGQVVISTAAKIGELTSERDRSRALEAAKKKDRDGLRVILTGELHPKDPLGEEIVPAMRPIFVAASIWPKRLDELRQVIDWLKESVNEPEGRVLKEQISVQPFEESFERIEASRPWCVCPYCEHAAEEGCPVCGASGFLTRQEHEQIEATSRQRYLEQVKREVASDDE